MKRILSVCLPAFLSSICSAATITVDPTGGADFTSIQPAIDAAKAGESIRVAPGTYPESIQLREGIRLLGSGAAVTILRAPSYFAVVQAASGCEISGFTITSVEDDVDGITCSDCRDLLITRNIITGNSWSGIDLLNSSAIISNNIIQDNRSAGIFCRNGSTPLIVNNTIVGNHNEAGVNSWSGSSPRVVNNIFLGNTGYGGVFCDEASAEISKNVFWMNSNLDGDPVDIVGCDGGSGNIFADPLPVDPSGDFHLLPGSPCIDAGIPEEAPAVDFDGAGRPCGSGVDIGAFELGGCKGPAEFVRGNADGEGDIDITDAVFLLNHLFLSGVAPGCLDAADANDDGELDLSDAVFSLNFQFLGGIPPASPFPGCGIDGWIDGLDCGSYPGCNGPPANSRA